MADTLQSVFGEGYKQEQLPEYESWVKSQDPKTLRTVVEKLDPVIQSVTKQYGGRNPSPTLYHRARLIAADAVRSYDPKKGSSLKTHIANQLRRLQRMAPQITDPLSPPERFNAQQIEIKSATDELTDILGREPTDEEIADTTDIPLKRVIKVRTRMRARLPSSVYEESTDDDDEMADIVGSSYSPEDEWYDAVYSDLGPIDRLIMMHRTGYRGATVLPNSVIAQKLRLSPAAISQRASRIQNRLDQFHG